MTSEIFADGSPTLPTKPSKVLNSTPGSAQARAVPREGDQAGSYASRPLRRPLAGTATDKFERRPRYGFTEDWLKNNLARQRASERGNWWSDESDRQSVGSAHPEPLEPGEAWLEFTGENHKGQGFERRGSVAEQREPLELLATTPPHHQGRHRVQTSDTTVRQQELWENLGSKPNRIPVPTKMPATGLANSPSTSSYVPNGKGHHMEKPLPPPPPPFERTASEAPVLSTAANVPSPLSTPSRASVNSTQSIQRSKKKVIWRGKACIIALPLEDGRSEGSRTSSFLKPEEVAERFARWERDGYDTSGFVLSSTDAEAYGPTSDGQSRKIYPDPDDGKKEWQQSIYRVSIPDRREWEAYVNRLNEEKLRALGVSFGDEEPLSRVSSAVASMSRQASSQRFALPISPPLASSSVSTAHGPHYLNPFSPPFMASTNPSSLVASMESPGLHYNGPHGELQNSNRSMPYPNGAQTFGPLFQVPQQQPSSPLQGTITPQQYFGPQAGSRTILSPSLEPPQKMGTLVLPRSPSIPETNQQQGHPGTDDLFTKMRNQQAQLQAQLHQQQHQQQQQLNPRSFVNPADSHNFDESKLPRYVSQPDIASPAPRGHRHNLSETLQREIDEAEYHLEESIRRQLDEEDEETSEFVREDGDTSGRPHLGEGFKINTSDLDTNPSIAGTPEASIQSAAQQMAFLSGHRSKASMSKLNVQAPEFRFEPKMTTTSAIFSFLGNQPSLDMDAPGGRGSGQSASQSRHTSNASVGAFGSNFNVDAPAFTPGITRKPTAPSREFSFSSGGPSFKPDAQSFIPSASAPHELGGSGQSSSEAPENGAKKIFGNIDFSEIIKPSKRSKAIPIVKPDNDQKTAERDAEGQEDESGRITQAYGRQKRMRRNDNDPDQVPLFAEPTLDTTIGIVESPPPTGLNAVTTPRADGEGATSLENAADQLKDLIDDYQASETSSLTRDHDPVDADGKPWEPYEFREVADAASFNAALPRAYAPEEAVAGSPVREDPDDTQSDLTLHKDHTPVVLTDIPGNAIKPNPGIMSNHTKKTSLSATAQPFEYKPPAATIDAGPKSKISGSSVTGVNGGLTASRFAPSVSPPTQLERGPWNKSQAGGLEPLPPDRIDSFGQVPDSESDEVDGVTYLEPSFQEIDAVMRHLSEKDPDLGVERTGSPWQRSSPQRSSLPGKPATAHQLLAGANLKSEVPSPSPQRSQQQYEYLSGNGSDVNESVTNGSESANTAEIKSLAPPGRFSPHYSPKHAGNEMRSRIHRLNSPDNVPISDWDDAVASIDETTLQSRSRFFDQRIDDLVGGVIQERLVPLEKTLATIQNSLEMLPGRPASGREPSSRSAEIKHSDADDEDDINQVLQPRVRSPFKERKYNKLKASLLEAVAAQQVSAPITDASNLTKELGDLKASIQQVPNATSSHIKTVVEEAVARQMRGKSGPITQSQGSAAIEKLQLQITGLESMLKIADTRAEHELKARRVAEDALADNQRQLRLAEQEAAQQRESAEETERSLRAFHDERLKAMRHTALLEAAQESLEITVSELSDKNGALDGTLEEYRLSSIKWRAEVEESKNENKGLRRTVNALKAEMENSIRGRHALRTKFDRLQEDLTLAARDIARDQSMWRYREEEYKARHELLRARLEAEARTRERLELEIERLEAQEKEAMKMRFAVEEVQKMNSRLEETITALRQESHEHQETAARFEREFHDARESGRMEVQRTRTAMAADIESANNQVNIIRVDFESEIARLQRQLENAKIGADTAKARHELMLEEATESRRDAIREAADASEAVLQEHYRFHARTLEGLRSEHERALKHALEDKQRSEAHLQERLALSDEKMEYHRERVNHLEEKLEIAKSAAHAAVQAAQSARSTASPPSVRPSIPLARGSNFPEKISPQALRESIMVLQEQLQEREGRIEKLEQELSKVDKDAPTKIKDRDIEISWLRELLGVRIDELEDIITTLSQPTYDREAVRDAAIRLKANLQMEQQEKERAMAGGQAFPSLSRISNLASSPRALPLAAAAAWGNWRKARDISFGNFSDIANGAFGGSDTPSRSSPPAQGFLSGLMTPPSTNMRTTPPPFEGSPTALRPASANSRPLRQYSTPRQSLSRKEEKKRDMEPPTTPPLLRKGSYDQDAESHSFGMGTDDDDVVGRQTRVEREGSGDEPFGASIRT